MPSTEQLQLPSGRVIRVCVECAREFPRHGYFCSAVREYSRSQVLREMVRVEDEINRLEALIGDAGGDEQLERDMRTTYGPEGKELQQRTPLLRLAGNRFLLRNEFWEWAWWLGLDFWQSTKAARAAVRAEVANMRRADDEKAEEPLVLELSLGGPSA